MPRLSYDERGLYLDGTQFQLISGSICYFRIFPQQWKDRLAKLVALGANAVEVYVPWNFHEPRQGEWDFEGGADVAEFIRLAGEVGLLVLLRPGPYICAEWCMGGLPWWLLSPTTSRGGAQLRLRCGDPRYLEAAEAYLRRLAKEVTPLLSSRGGPIVAVQVENEYGYWGTDRRYLERLRDLIRETLGPELMLFTVDGCYTPETQRLGGVDGALRTASFGSGAQTRFAALRAVQPEGPLACMEFWVGWFSTWGGGAKMERSASSVARELAQMLAMGASVNIFVFAGGTSFGFWAGANLDAASGRLEPHVTSYDYDGLLSESGALTEKFHACRRVITAHTNKVPLLPELYVQPPTLRPRAVPLPQCVPLLGEALPAVATGTEAAPFPLPIEALGEGLGYVLYRYVGTRAGDAAEALATLAGLPLKLYGVRDFAVVLFNGQTLGVWDRSVNAADLTVPAGAQSLEIIVEITARINFGPGLAEQKGLGRVAAGIRAQDERELFGWECYALPMRAEQLAGLRWPDGADAVGIGAVAAAAPRFYRGVFELAAEEVGQACSWLRVRGLKRGFVALNGFNLGWHRREGPQLSLYVPPQLLQEGENEVVVFEFLPARGAAASAVPSVLLEAEPVWRRDRRQLLAFRAREAYGFVRQVGARRLLLLAWAELGARGSALLLALVLALLAAGLAVFVGWKARH